MKPARVALEKESLVALHVTAVRRDWFSYQPAFTNVLLLLALLAFVAFACVGNQEVAVRTFFLGGGLVLLGLGTALLSGLASACARRRAGEITFRRETFTLRLPESEWTLPNHHLVALQLNYAAVGNRPAQLLTWGHVVTIALPGQRLSFALLDVPPDARAVLSSLNVKGRASEVPWWEQPTGSFLVDCLSGWTG
ncbi:hypothetical protein [Hymenobacter negativus]|uniref:DUF58 domain-containing protein n=1 Tax=Hymenobacter negativus TaxID=2795026 RepID=A0ABS3QGP3_9BACT|nr:hypothetical protein [Hymenobacter negativus]MBO2010422.1 hypothetical protein [Hymenobacter negativus]